MVDQTEERRDATGSCRVNPLKYCHISPGGLKAQSRFAVSLHAIVFCEARRPFPDIPDHVVDAVVVRREGRDRRGAIETVGAEILLREFALPRIGKMRPFSVSSLPQANSAPSSPPRAANSHSASVGRSLPAPSRIGERVGIGRRAQQDGCQAR